MGNRRQRAGRPVVSFAVGLCVALVALSATEAHGQDGDIRGVAWSWPTGGSVPVVRPFDPPDQAWAAGHRGVDLDVTVGSPVLAPADGTVVAAGTIVDRGVVSIQIRDVRATFEPVKALVAVGQHVRRGQVIATVEEGHAPGALHWGAKIGPRRYVNPLRMLVERVVLKPWDD